MRAVLAVRSCCSPSAHCSSPIILCLKFFFQLPNNWVIPIRYKLWTLAARVVPAETLGSAPTESTADDMAALRRAANNASANEHVGFDHILIFLLWAEQISWHLPSPLPQTQKHTCTHYLTTAARCSFTSSPIHRVYVHVCSCTIGLIGKHGWGWHN